jgi:hypothetical protein
MLKNKLLLIWAIFIALHTVIALPLSEEYNPGVLLIYAIIAILSSLGLPVFLNPHSGWGWATPNMFGWAMGVLFWIILYLFIAYLMLKLINKLKNN